MFGGLSKDVRALLVPPVLRLRRFRLCVFSVAPGVGVGRLAVAQGSCLCLVVRVRYTETALLDYLRFKGAAKMPQQMLN